MRYMLLLYKYVSNHQVKNIRVLEEFIGFINENNINIEDACEYTDEFKETEYFSTKSTLTQKNYVREINKFIDTVYAEQGYKKKARIIEKQSPATSFIPEVKRDESDPEYQAFLRKYEEITKLEAE